MSTLKNSHAWKTRPGYYTTRNTENPIAVISRLDTYETTSEFLTAIFKARDAAMHQRNVLANEIDISAAAQLIQSVSDPQDILTIWDTARKLEQHYGFYSKGGGTAVCAVKNALERMVEVGAAKKINVCVSGNYQTAYEVIDNCYRVNSEF